MKKKIDIKELKKAFDKVTLRHDIGENGMGGKTTALLVKGDNVYGGVAYCVDTDQFNRTRGRQIALGRALHAFEVSTKNKKSRERFHASSFIGRLVFGDEPTKPTVLVEQKL